MAGCDLASYYASATFLTGLTGSTLLAAIHTHVTRGSTVIPYTSSSRVDTWDALAHLDADPLVPGSIIDIYSGRSLLATDHSTTGWNREHVFPKSLGVGYTGADTSDVHSLRACDWNINSARGNKPYGECSKATEPSCTSPAHVEAAADTSASSTMFKPPAQYRGDLARSLFFMAARYDGSEQDTFNLQLSDCPSAGSYAMGYLSTLRRWHSEDPPDAREQWRTGEVCSLYQNNRNPFVDHPELVERVWGSLADSACNGVAPAPATPAPLAPTPMPTVCEPCLMLTAIMSGDLPGGLPKAIELFVACDIASPSDYGFGSATNGGGSSGQEYKFPSSVGWRRGTYLRVAYESATYPESFYRFFGYSPDYTSSSLSVNGNDAIELFWKGELIESYGSATGEILDIDCTPLKVTNLLCTCPFLNVESTARGQRGSTPRGGRTGVRVFPVVGPGSRRSGRPTTGRSSA